MNRASLISALSLFCSAVILAGCSGPKQDTPGPERVVDHGPGPTVFAQVPDNVRNDSLLTQTTFDLGDGTFVMVASNVQETFEGVRLLHYRLGPDSSAAVLSTSSPAYDSWTMFPTFFSAGDSTNALLILANFGERESWGQKFLRMDDRFTDLGFLDIALPVRELVDDTLQLKRRSIGEYARIEHKADTTIITFACDSVFLYDDLDGHMDLVLPSNAIRYTFNQQQGLSLWVKGRRKARPAPEA